MADPTKRKMSGWMARLMSTAEEREAGEEKPGEGAQAKENKEDAPGAEASAQLASAEKTEQPEPPPLSGEGDQGNGRPPELGSSSPSEAPAFPSMELPEKDQYDKGEPEEASPEAEEQARSENEAAPEEEGPVSQGPSPSENGQEESAGTGAAMAIAEVTMVEWLLEGPPPVPPAVPAEEGAEQSQEEADGGAEEEAGATTGTAEEGDLAVDEAPPPLPGPTTCTCCGAAWIRGNIYCADCGFMLPATPAPTSPTQKSSAARIAAMPQLKVRLRSRYEVGELIQERQGIGRFRGTDRGSTPNRPITIVWGPLSAGGGSDNPFDDVPVAVASEDEDILPSFEEPVPVAAPVLVDADGRPVAYPSVAWEKAILEKAKHPAIPALIDHFVENNFEYLILEAPAGKNLWEAWDEPEAGEAGVRYSWLMQVAEGLHALHLAGAIIEGIRPELVTLSGNQAVISDLTDLLPIPVPAGAPIRGTLYTAPELMLSPNEVDARADMYSFGAMVYSLEYLHLPLEDKHFERPFAPKSIADEFPDVHPLILRLVNKTFVRDLNVRFPTDEAIKTDPSGFQELIRALEVCRRTLDNGRLDIACWTTTGMIRSGNEDAFTLLHGVDARLDDTNEYAMVLLADGMGGYEAGEIAAALAMNELRTYLLQQPIFAGLTGGAPPAGPVNVESHKQVLFGALKHTNKAVYTAARTPGKGKRGMGCTAEAVYIDGRNVIVGHVGDSRTYHVTQGRLIQLTRDQTLVNRLVELGQISAEEAEDHPRKNELQQAIGGQPEVLPGTYSGKLKRGDWVLVCSDGVTNHISNKELEKMLTREAYDSADTAARRLVNLVNLRGATDNSTVVLIRVC